MKWSDNTFEKIYWQAQPAYRRPDAAQLTAACRYVLNNYAAGEGAVEEWRKALHILLLGLQPLGDDVPDRFYVLANNTDSPDGAKELPTVASNDKVTLAPCPALAAWHDRLNSLLAQQDDRCTMEVHMYFGCLALVLSQCITHRCDYVMAHMHECFSVVAIALGLPEPFRTVPNAPSTLHTVLEAVFEQHSLFNKEIICRVIRANSMLSLTEPCKRTARALREACLDAWAQSGSGLYHWFNMASINPGKLFGMLDTIGGFDDVIKGLRYAHWELAEAPYSNSICHLLHQKCCASLYLAERRNVMAFGAFVTIADRHPVAELDKLTSEREKYPFVYALRLLPNYANRDEDLRRGYHVGRSIRTAIEQERRLRQIGTTNA